MDRSSKNGVATPKIMVSQKDAELLESVYNILKTGNDVEIRIAKNGELKLLEIIKRVFKYN